MSEQIKKSDISEKDIFEYIIVGAEKAQKEIDAMNIALKETAQISKNTLKNKPTDASGLKATEQAIKASNANFDKKIKLEQQSVLTKKQMQSAEQSLQKQREKGIAQMKKESDAYFKLVQQTRDLKNESKRLGAEMLALENQGKENTKEFRDLARQYKNVTSEATVLDGKLKKLDSNVGDNFRNVGNYSKAIGGLKNMLGQLGLAFGVFQGVRALADTEIRLQSLQLALKNVMGTTNEYNKSFKFLTELSQNYGQDLLVLTDTYKSFIASSNSSGLAIEERNKIYQSIIKSGSSLALSNEQIEGSLLAVSQMFSKGKVSAEELRGQLGERLPGAFGIMAKSMGVTEQQLDKMLSQGQVIAKDVLPLFATELEKTFGKDAEKNLTTIGGAWNVLKTNISLYINEANEGGKVTTAIANIISFLAKNIDLVVSAIGFAIKSWITYKSVMAGLKLKDNIQSFIELKKAVKGSADELKASEKGAKGFGKALTAIGLTVAIDLLWEMGKAIFNFASSAMQADYWMRKFNEGLTSGSKSAEIFLGKLEKVNQKRRDELDVLRAKGKITQKEYDKETAILNSSSKKQIDIKLKEARELYRIEKERIAKLRAEYAKNKYTQDGAITLAQIGTSKEKLGILQGYVLDLEQAEKGYTRELIANNIAQIESAKATKASTKELKELKKAYADVTDEIIKRFSIEEQADQASKDYAITDAQKQLEDQVKLTDQYGTINNQRVDELLKEEEALRRKQIEEMNITQEERNFRLIELEDEMAQKRVDIYKDLEQKQEDYALKIQQKEGEILKDRFAETKKWVDLTADYFIKRSEEKIAQLDKEIEAGQKQYDVFAELAKNGNITAQQSLAEQQNIINEANRKKMAEQKRIERLKLAETAFNVYGAKVEAGDKNPLVSTIKDITLLSQFISALPAFEDGTENTGANGRGVDGKGGFHAILHPHERVLTKEQNNAVGDLTNAELSNLALKYNTGQLIDLKRQDVAGNSYDLIPLLGEIKELQNIIKNKPENNIELGKITQTTMQIVESSKRGNITNRNIYSIKRR